MYQQPLGEVTDKDDSSPADEPDCLPGSYKWLKLTTGVSRDQAVEPAVFRNSSCQDPPKAPPVPADAGRDSAPVGSVQTQPEDSWLRARNGVLQRQVMLQNLSQATQYNGCVGWAEVSQLESAANQPPRLLMVQLTAPERQVQVSSAHIFVVGPLCRQQKPRDSLFTVALSCTRHAALSPSMPWWTRAVNCKGLSTSTSQPLGTYLSPRLHNRCVLRQGKSGRGSNRQQFKRILPMISHGGWSMAS
jgi:hypothetical protein